jgi:predicted phosphodiesterase
VDDAGSPDDGSPPSEAPAGSAGPDGSTSSDGADTPVGDAPSPVLLVDPSPTDPDLSGLAGAPAPITRADGDGSGDEPRPAADDPADLADDGAADAVVGRGRWSPNKRWAPGRRLARLGRRSWVQRWGRRAKIGVFALAGAVVALALLGRVKAEIGPFDATVAARPSFSSDTTVRLAPLGTIVLDTHNWPLALDLRADQIGLAEAKQIANHPEQVDRLGDDVAGDVQDAMFRLAVRCALAAVAGGMIGAFAAQAKVKTSLAGGLAGIVLVGSIGGGTAATFDANAVAEPRYTGLLTAAPAAVGDVQSIVERYGEYRAQLSELVSNVTTLYLAAENLPTYAPDDDTIRVLHVSDVHLNPQAFDLMEQVVDQFAVDVVVDTGDLTDWGTEPEGRLVDEIGRLGLPYLYVRGNHDSRRTQEAVADQPNATVLDGDATTVAGLTFWGIGDPRYTPNKDQPTGQASEREKAESFAPTVASRLAADENEPDQPDVDVLLIHDVRAAADVAGRVPLVLAGHTHRPSESHLGDDDQTLVLVEGSTGGAGLRGLQGDEPHPLTASVLYFDADTKQLVAYDRISVKGFGETGATIERHVVPAGEVPEEDPDPVLNRSQDRTVDMEPPVASTTSTTTTTTTAGD